MQVHENHRVLKEKEKPNPIPILNWGGRATSGLEGVSNILSLQQHLAVPSRGPQSFPGQMWDKVSSASTKGSCPSWICLENLYRETSWLAAWTTSCCFFWCQNAVVQYQVPHKWPNFTAFFGHSAAQWPQACHPPRNPIPATIIVNVIISESTQFE